jgi:carboxypeptidase Q
MRSVTLFVVLAIGRSLLAQESFDEDVVGRIKIEGFQHSQVMETLALLTDVHGPRLTGSPALKAASEWSRDRLAEWGLENAHLESWGHFGRGWSLEGYSVEMVAPRYSRLMAIPHAWSTSTRGVISGKPILVEIHREEDYAKYRGQLKGAIVLFGAPQAPRSRFAPLAERYDEEELDEMLRAIDTGNEPHDYWEDVASWQGSTDKWRHIASFLGTEEVGALIVPSERDEGIVHVTALGYYMGTDVQTFPSLVMAKEHYRMLTRLHQRNVPLELRVSVDARFHEDDLDGYNVVAEIPGTDPEIGDELVMVGAHLDSWHAATGATDNASGSAVVMEAVRILEAIGAEPRRTIRIALWTGEEQGYFGSLGYVTQHFGDPETLVLEPEHAKLSAYYNLDNGTGRIRGLYLQGNEAARPVFEEMLAPFDYLEASTLTTEDTSGTDHLPFQSLGLPGFQFIQDPIDYETVTHHTNLDLYDNVMEDDLKQAAVIIASVVYRTAMRDEMMPRAPMPKPHRSATIH